MRVRTGKCIILCIFFTLISLMIMFLIFCFSSQVADESQALSDSLLYMIINGNVPIVSDLANSLFEVIPFRKCAHAIIYFLLGISTCAAVGFGQIRRFYDWIFDKKSNAFFIPLIICILYSITDEIHQMFVAGRSCEFRDVCIDSIGALVGIIIVRVMLESVIKRLQKKYYYARWIK